MNIINPIHQGNISPLPGITWKTDPNNLSIRSLHGMPLLFLNKRNDFANIINKEFYNLTIKKVSTIINGMPHQLFESDIHIREIYAELKRCCLQRALLRDRGRVFNKKNWTINRYAFSYGQHSSWEQ